jgi:hypothetical protein
MFMRVRRTVPQFTFILSERFVNHKSSVSTGFFRFFPVLFASGHISPQKTQQNGQFSAMTNAQPNPSYLLQKNISTHKSQAHS